jgi:hypothetical protein
MYKTGCISFPLCSESHRPPSCNADTGVRAYTDWYKLLPLWREIKSCFTYNNNSSASFATFCPDVDLSVVLNKYSTVPTYVTGEFPRVGVSFKIVVTNSYHCLYH